MKNNPPMIFKKDDNEYTLLSNTVATYMKQAALYVAKMNNIPLEEATKLVKQTVKKSNIKNPEVKYYTKDHNGDTYQETNKLSNYVKETIESGEIIVPSFTTYVHPTVKKSLHAEFLQDNINKRKEDKHKAFVYKQENNPDMFLYYNTLQKTRKIFNNSLSGAYAAKGTILYNASAHYTLTSMTRSVTSIGNAITETMVASNKHFKDYETTVNYITTVITTYEKDKFIRVLKKYNLHLPTPEEVHERILLSSKKYWESIKYEGKILDYLKTLSKVELAAVLYTNDMNAIKDHNDEMMRTFISTLSKRCTSGSEDNIRDINNSPEGVMNLVYHICAPDIKGMNVDFKKMAGTETLNILASTARNVTKTLIAYSDFIRACFITKIMPPTIAHIKDMFREAIVLSDTDSTCGAYDKWIEWYFGKIVFNDEAVGVSAAVMTITTQVIDHYLKMFTSHMNIPPENRDLIKMKNEYFWDLFTSTNVSKHYFANVRIQEGSVFAVPDLELKGVHLIASKVNKEIRDIAYGMIDYIHTTLSSGGKISLNKMATLTADTERKIIEDIKNGKTDIFKLEKLKEESAYKLDRTKSPYIHHLLWEYVFKDKYGDPGEPTYMVVNIPTTLSSKRTTQEYLDKLEDREIAERLREFMDKYKKDNIGSFRVPLNIVAGKKLPEEIYQAVNFYKVVTSNLNIMYLILESCGFFRKSDMLVSEMGY